MYLVKISLANIFAILANVASSFIHLFLIRSSFGGGSMLMWIWLFNFLRDWIHYCFCVCVCVCVCVVR